MTTDARDLYRRYLPWQRSFEIGFWVMVFLASATINSIVVWLDMQRDHLTFAVWEPVVWEWSSNLILLGLMPALLAFDRRFSLRYGLLRQHLPWHGLACVVFSLLHVLGMVLLRKLAYAVMGSGYDFGPWPRELFYEFLKDSRAYFIILVAVYSYRLLLLRLQGEAHLLDAPDDAPPVESIERPERFLVRKLGKEFLVAAADIEWLQASANYVNLHVRGRDYPLRTTMTDIESRLDGTRFVRVHRSYIVNLDFLAEIEPLDTGDARLRMQDGSMLPCSRRYRASLRPTRIHARSHPF